MSHFTVLVVTDMPDDLEAALQPFHEFECTGEDDQYVQDIDQTEEARAEYESQTETRLRDPDGNLHEPWADEFYREPTEQEVKNAGPLGLMGTGFGNGVSHTSRDWEDGKGYRAKIRFVPEGWEEVEVPRKDTETFAEFVDGWYGKKPLLFGQEPSDEHKYGYAALNEAGEIERVIDRTNPNKQWDWYKIGGRWSGMLRAKSGTEGVKGEPGLADSEYDSSGVDQCRVGDLDLEVMLNIARERKFSAYRKAFEKAQQQDIGVDWMKGADAWERWNQMLVDAGASEKALRAKWEAVGKGAFFKFIDDLEAEGDPDAVLLRLSQKLGADNWNGVDLGKTAEQRRDEVAPICTFAVLKDGEWYERGRMGWWAAVHDEKAEGQWEAEFAKMLADLPADKWVTVVDCHI